MLLAWMSEHFGEFLDQFSTFGWVDALDIIVLALAMFGMLWMFRGTRSASIATGFLICTLALCAFSFLDMPACRLILSGTTVVVFVIVFQPEIRRAFNTVGLFVSKLLSSGVKKTFSVEKSVVDEICNAVFEMSKTNTGAIIAVETDVRDEDVVTRGTVLDAEISSKLLENIFVDRSPLHDGAVFLRNGRIHSAGNYCFLTSDERLIGGLGSRHRAAVGLSERSDSLVIIVSEETGTVSVAYHGQLERNYTYERLHARLEETMIAHDKPHMFDVQEKAVRRRVFGAILYALLSVLLSVILHFCAKGASV